MSLLIQYHTHEHKETFLNYDFKKDRLDQFIGSYIKGNKMYASFWLACKILCTLSHWQSDVERGFSVNKELLLENLCQTSLVAQRIYISP